MKNSRSHRRGCWLRIAYALLILVIVLAGLHWIFIGRRAEPIRFYGLVLDENGKGIPGVKVHYRTSIPIFVIPIPFASREYNHYHHGTCATGQDGRFKIDAGRRYILAITNIGKKGYRKTGHEERSYNYVPYPQGFIPNPSKPVRFLLVKEGIPKPKKVFSTKWLHYKWNEGPMRIFLGEKIGTLVIDGKRKKKPKQFSNFPWSVDISMEGSEFRSWPNYFFPLAPLDGYASHWHYDSEQDRHEPPDRYVFRTDAGLYGILNCEIWPSRDKGKTSVQVSVYLNESGARNLK